MEGSDEEEEWDSSENVKEHSQEHEEQDLEGDSREDIEENVKQYAEDDEGDVGMDTEQEVAIPPSLLCRCISFNMSKDKLDNTDLQSSIRKGK
ncbi:hypothetical protein SCLCIDRAFT_25041 [Scleroderma citrinum Foug A]|uniref:Uncharacterized protein n=1 Tax=Scleroderma citrinum Foug A TaxID=1036808 RepID=A0A0C3ABJ3_9AGAM|nr:hypothetical protein SCLCIDRAFT_25041 [Scleroderma citrinum Foug A]